MKIKPKHYTRILEAIRPLAHKFPTHRAALIKERKARDIEKRLRWDMAHAAKLKKFFCDEIYSYANDEHIDTALRQAIKEIEEKP